MNLLEVIMSSKGGVYQLNGRKCVWQCEEASRFIVSLVIKYATERDIESNHY